MTDYKFHPRPRRRRPPLIWRADDWEAFLRKNPAGTGRLMRAVFGETKKP
jgi:hypothetical protein